ncbi:hypothetical protein HZ326_19759 [Fusarium oxysporum f. sp. albedinis]|nr:Mucin-19 [Fusarium oxysporum f. sp. albedinis]KAJ0137267.1 hypothetical protein HZ326_19759 [Fusarium oxysporum f. sp. albedinis]
MTRTSRRISDLGVACSSQFIKAIFISFTKKLASFSSQIWHRPQLFRQSCAGITPSLSKRHTPFLRSSACSI